MPIHPSVVVGVGTSGALVVANIERIFYEVLGDLRLELLRLLVVEAATHATEVDSAPGGRRSEMVNAHVGDTSAAYRDLKTFLGGDFDWCPADLRISGQGAGNVRAGGRLMYHSRFPAIWAALERNITA